MHVIQSSELLEAVSPSSAHALATAPSLDALPAPLLGQRFADRFELIQQLTYGESGVSYLAEDNNRGYHVVLKMYHSELSQQPGFCLSLLRAQWLQGQLALPGILTLDLLQKDPFSGRLFSTVPYLQGQTLLQKMEVKWSQGLSFMPNDVLMLLEQIAQLLWSVHSGGAAHGYLKPSKILFTPQYQDAPIYLSGLAAPIGSTFVQDMEAFQPSPYLSEDAIGRSGHPKAADDLYSLGMLVFVLLTGEVPHSGSLPLHSSSLSPAILNAVNRALMSHRSVGFASLDEMLMAFREALAGRPYSPMTPSPLAPILSEPTRSYANDSSWIKPKPQLSPDLKEVRSAQLARLVDQTICIDRDEDEDDILVLHQDGNHRMMKEAPDTPPPTSSSMTLESGSYADAWDGTPSVETVLFGSQKPAPMEVVVVEDDGMKTQRLSDESLHAVQQLPQPAWSETPVYQFATPHPSITAMAVNLNGTILSTAGEDGVLTLWNTASWEPVHQLAVADDVVQVLEWSSDSRFLACVAGNGWMVEVWDLATEQRMAWLEHQAQVRALCWSQSGRYIATSCEDDSLSVWDVMNQECIASWHLSQNPAQSLVMNEATQTLVSGHAQGHIHLWNYEKQQYEGMFARVPSDVYRLRIYGSSARLYSAHANGQILGWDLESSRQVNLLDQHRNAVTALRVGENPSTLYSTALDQTLRIWDTHNDRLRYTFFLPSSTSHLALLPSSYSLVTTHENEVYVWQVP
ncbi:MAG: hypothetical protein EP343_02650 [Deltaproteobacteria bacterium]|nr:MAG: hypothetical protein EP343_02650 [Deltaproteobacteria bacterium]